MPEEATANTVAVEKPPEKVPSKDPPSKSHSKDSPSHTRHSHGSQSEGWIDVGVIHIRPTSDGSGQWEVLSQGKHRRVCAASLFAFSIYNPVRQRALWFIEWKWFERFILTLIVFNSLLLSAYQYRDQGATVNKIMENVDPILLVFFTLETLIKVVAIGFWKDQNSYLRDGWNWLDFVVVVSGIIGILPLDADGGSLAWLRVFRVLRPLRSLTVMPQMRILVNTVLKSIPRLMDVMGMAIFLSVVFGIMAVMFFSGVMHRTCRETPTPVWDQPLQCWRWTPVGERLCGGMYMCEDLDTPYCGSNFLEEADKKLRPSFNGTDDMKGFEWCMDEGVPFRGEPTMIGAYNWRFTHFDHLPAAVLVIFQCTTLEGWTDIQYMLEDSFSDWFVPLYFCIMIFMTNFFLLNVALAVIWEAFSEFSAQAAEEKKKEDDEDGDDDACKGEEEEEAVGLTDDGEPPYLNIAPVLFLRKIAFSERFVSVIMFFITANVVTMMMDKFPPPDVHQAEALDILNIIFTWVFVGEMIVVHGALGPRKYWTNPITAFDGIIVASSVAEFFMGGSGAIRAFRGFRLLRIFRLAKKWTSFRVLLKSIAETVMSMGNFTVLLVIMIFVFTLMAMNFFALQFKFVDGEGEWIGLMKWEGHEADTKIKDPYCGKMFGNDDVQADGEHDLSCVPRAHFDTFVWSFVTIFQILSGENWNTVMYDGMKSGGYGWCLFFVAVVIVGQMIILNLFLAILMAKFEDASSTISAQEKEKKQALGQMAASTLVTSVAVAPGKANIAATNQQKAAEKDPNASLKEAADASGKDNGIEQPECATPNPTLPGQLPEGELPPPEGETTKANEAEANPDSTEASPEKRASGASYVDSKLVQGGLPKFPQDYAFMCLSTTNPIRVNAKKLAHNTHFDNFILACILISSAFMALDSPLHNPDWGLPTFLRAANLFFSICFLIEMVLKMVAMGLWWGKNCYLRNNWNILDFIVVCVSVIDMLNLGSALKSLKTLRMLRALRPLRVISRNESLKLVVNTLFKSVPELVNLLIVGVLFFLIFALFGVGYFKGAFYACDLDGFNRNVPFALFEGANQTNTLPQVWAIMDDHAKLQSPKDNRDKRGTYEDMMIPLCVNPSKDLSRAGGALEGAGTATALGTFEDDVFTMQGKCEPGNEFYRRVSMDTPICVGRCQPVHSYDGPRPEFCLPPPTKVEELPPVAKCAERTWTQDELNGMKFYEAMQVQNLLSCAGGDNFLGCREKYCPDDNPALKPTPSTVKNCAAWCERSNIFFCTQTCKDTLENGAAETPECSECRRQCRAACECPDYCTGYIDDAATCVEQGGLWQQSLSQNFDSIFEAMLTLFEISTTEGWVDVMYAGTDARGAYKQPIRDYVDLWAFFFVIFILVGSFFILNLCVGVILDNFNKIKDSGGEIFMTPDQQEWMDAKKAFLKKTVFFGLHDINKQPPMRVKAYYFVSHPTFDGFIMTCIMLNTVTMAMKVFPTPSEEYASGLVIVNYCFAVIFTCECIIKLYALRANYFHDNWNVFDFSCVNATIVGIILNEATDLEIGSVMSAIRLFRIARLFRLVRFAKGLNRLFSAFLLSIPKLLNVAGIMCLMLFLFAVLGVQSFALVKFDEDFDGAHSTHGNFRDWGRGMMLLVRSMTGEGFNELMHSFSRNEVHFMQALGDKCYPSDLHEITLDPPNWDILNDKCLIDNPNQCGKSIFAYIYFVSYTCLITFIIFNLVVAVILEGFEEAREESELVDQCIQTWKRYDPNYSMVLPLAEVFAFVKEVADDQDKMLVDQGKLKAGQSHLLTPFNLPPMKGKGTNKPEVDLNAIPMWIASSSKLAFELDSQTMHFIDIVKMTFAVVLSQNSYKNCTVMKQKAEEDVKGAKKLKHLEDRHKQKKEFLLKIPSVSTTDLATEVASTKIQVLFQRRKDKKLVQREREAAAERRKAETPPAAG